MARNRRRTTVAGRTYRRPSALLSAAVCVVCGVATFGVSRSALASDGGAPTGLSVNDRACGATGAPPFLRRTGPTGVVVKAHLSEPDAEADAPVDFAVWPADNPAQRTEWSSAARYPAGVAWGDVPASVLQEGGSYVVAARSRRGDESSPWSADCALTIDFVRPDRPALISSADYPTANAPGTGGAGVPGTFSLSADGVADAIGFQYGLAGVTEFVAADQPGGTATIRVTPSRSGLQHLSVDIIDRAGNRSNTAVYDFYVAGTEPTITDADPTAWAGEPHHLTLRANAADVASFTYRLDGQPPRTVAAEPDGTAQVTVVPPQTSSGIEVVSTTRTGARSAPAWMLLYADTRPFVASEQFPLDGTPGAPVGTGGTFTLRPHRHNVVAYVYQFNRGEVDQQPFRVVRATAEGTATIPFTPARAGTNDDAAGQARSPRTAGTVRQPPVRAGGKHRQRVVRAGRVRERIDQEDEADRRSAAGRGGHTVARSPGDRQPGRRSGDGTLTERGVGYASRAGSAGLCPRGSAGPACRPIPMSWKACTRGRLNSALFSEPPPRLHRTHLTASPSNWKDCGKACPRRWIFPATHSATALDRPGPRAIWHRTDTTGGYPPGSFAGTITSRRCFHRHRNSWSTMLRRRSRQVFRRGDHCGERRDRVVFLGRRKANAPAPETRAPDAEQVAPTKAIHHHRKIDSHADSRARRRPLTAHRRPACMGRRAGLVGVLLIVCVMPAVVRQLGAQLGWDPHVTRAPGFDGRRTGHGPGRRFLVAGHRQGAITPYIGGPDGCT